MAQDIFLKSKIATNALHVLTMLFLLLAGCDDKAHKSLENPHAKRDEAPSLEENTNKNDGHNEGKSSADEPKSHGSLDTWDSIAFMVRINPMEPQDEVYLADWRIRVHGIDDEGRRSSSVYYGMTGWDGNAIVELAPNMYSRPLIVTIYNDVIPLGCAEEEDAANINTCRKLQIFIPPYCYDQTIWVVSPFEDAVRQYYIDNSAARHGDAWSPSQVDCATWLADLNLLLLTDKVYQELQNLSKNDPFGRFSYNVLLEAFQENQQLLVPTHPPICMAERMHVGGTMRSGEKVELPIALDENATPFLGYTGDIDVDPIEIGANGIVSNICQIPLTGSLRVNSMVFRPEESNKLQDRNFIGVISHQTNMDENTNISVYNTKLGNGRELDSRIYEDACALTSVVQFVNTNDDEKNLQADETGVTFFNLFGDGANTEIYLTSDGDRVVDDDDFWVIFYQAGSPSCEEQVLAVELLGHRQGDFSDALAIRYDTSTEDLFLGLRKDYELDQALDPGQEAFLGYTLHTWSANSEVELKKLQTQFATCYLAADVWAQQFFKISKAELEFGGFANNCNPFCPLQLAEFAVRSQCFSNSRSNQRWQNQNAGYYSINSTHNVGGNIVINPGWLGPHLDFGIYVQKFDEAVFKGPRTIRRTNEVGELMVELPTLVEGDRVLIKSQESCCSDYDLVLPCVPEFTGFAGSDGAPYRPASLVPQKTRFKESSFKYSKSY